MIEQLLADAKTNGIDLWLDGERLRFRAPKGALSADFRQKLRTHKAAIIEYLRMWTLRPIPTQPDYPLSPAQWRLWVLLQMENSTAAYNVPLHQMIKGELDRGALIAGLQTLVQRHESLRTEFIAVDGQPRQRVRDDVALDVVCVEADPERIWEMSREEAQRPFDLTTAPLIRATLVRLAPQRHALLLTLHHIVCDGVSIGLLNAELGQLYAGQSLSPLPLQYRDYADWINRWLDSPAAAAPAQFWREQLDGEIPVLDMPTDFPRPAVQTFNGREYVVEIDAAQVHELARREGVTLFMFLLATLNVLLHRYTGAEDVIVGSPVAARSLAGLDEQVGFFLNTLPLRNQISADQPFATLLQQIKQTTTAALDNQLYPLDALLPQLDLRRDLSRAPLFDVLLILQNQRDAGVRLGSLDVRGLFQHSGTSKFDLTFNFSESGDRLQLGIEYNTDLFSAERIERMGRHWQTLLADVVARPTCAVGALKLLDTDEVAQLAAWNQTTRDYDLTLLPDQFEAQVAATPERIAVTCAGESLTYAELNRRANQVARQLQQMDGALVGLAVGRCAEMVIGLLAILKAGKAYVPIDPTYPAERVAYMLEASNITTVVTQAALREQFSGYNLLLLDTIDAAPCPNPSRTTQPDDLAYIIFTSGSTGKPKGVQIAHRSLANFMLAMTERVGITAQDRLLAVTTISFDIAALELFWPLLVGGEVVVAADDQTADGHALMRLLDDHAITVMQATPATWRLLLTVEWAGRQSLKILSGGEALPQALAADLLPRGCEVWNLYGPTEATIWATTHRVTAADVSDTRQPVTIGNPLANTTCHVLDDRMQPVPIGIVGNLYIGGVQVAEGYLNRPDLTAERFLVNGIQYSVIGDKTEHRLPNTVYRTGDLARWRNDGTLEFLGRDDFQVKVRGFRIELGEIEAVLLQHEAVREAVVTARGEQLVAYLVVRRPVGVEEMRGFIGRFLPTYMLPNQFITLDKLPLTLNGKVNRNALPDPSGQQVDAPYVAPRNEIERQIAAIWQTVLGVERVGIHDDFFDLGGHSLNGMRIVATIQRELNGSAALIDLFRRPTVAALAETIAPPELEEIAPMSDDELALLMEFDDD